MKNKYMFVCPKCLETYSSDTEKVKSCPNCHSDVIKMPISVSEWRKLDDSQKENYKKTYIKESFNGGFYYKHIESTPMNWYDYTCYWRIPVFFMACYVDYYNGRSMNMVYFSLLLLSVLFLLNYKKRNKTVLCIAIIIDFIHIGFSLLNFTSGNIGTGIGALLFGTCELIYYLRRKNLFTDDYDQSASINDADNSIQNQRITESKSAPITNGVEPSNSDEALNDHRIEADNELSEVSSSVKESITTQEASETKDEETDSNGNHSSNSVNSNKNKAKYMYCRKCGSQLIEGTSFCRKCGTRINE